MELVMIPKFNDFFLDEEIPSLENLLSDIPSSIVISTLAWINSELHIDPLDYKIHLKIFKALIERSPKDQIEEILNRLDFFSRSHPDKQISLFPLIVSLQFIEYEILNYRRGEFKKISPVDELNIFKAFLICNKDLDENHVIQLRESQKSLNKELPNEFFYKASWPFILSQYEHTQSNNLLVQAYLSFDFLKYLSGNKKYSPYVRKYMESINIKGNQLYIFKIIELYTNSFKAGGGKFIARFSPDILQKNTVLENFILEPFSILPEDYVKDKKNINFKGIRERPIIRYEDGFISVTNWKYLIDKLFQSFVFDFYHNSGIKEVVSFNDYKSDIGNDFAQNDIFEKFLDNCFSNSDGVCLKDQDNLINFDYYYRIDNKIILIEFKDIVLKYDTKYELIKEDIDKKLIHEEHKGKIKPKGVTQLFENIIKICDNYTEIDNFEEYGYSKSNIMIYPIIVYTHKALGIPGINDYLAEKLSQLVNQDHRGFFMIRELVTIDFEVFLNCFDSFKSGQIDLIILIENYLSQLSTARFVAKFNGSPGNRTKMFKTFEESMASMNKNCGFHGSSLYKDLEKRLFNES